MAEYLSEFLPCKQLKRTNDLESGINRLPDKTLVDILSLLPLKEAGRTSVLSFKWKDLWKSITCLNFDASKALLELRLSASGATPELLEPARSRFVTWVNQVLKSHTSPTLDEFIVKFDLDSCSSGDIDEWMKFVIPKRVKKLDIDLCAQCSKKPYGISEDLFLYFKNPSNVPNINCLVSLSLARLNVSGDIVEYFLSNCPHLESLAVSFSKDLVNLTVAGPYLPLKYLELRGCHWLKRLEVSAPKLVKFTYHGKGTNVHIGENPRLTQLFIGWLNDPCVIYALDKFGKLLGQLETLEFATFLMPDRRNLTQLPRLENLKHLILDVMPSFQTLMGFTKLIAAAPSLHKLTLQLSALDWKRRNEDIRASKHCIEPHECLKVVEVLGYVGGYTDTEILDYLFKNAVNLEMVVIDPYHPSDKEFETKSAQELKRTEERAAKLKEILPPSAKLVIAYYCLWFAPPLGPHKTVLLTLFVLSKLSYLLP